MEKPKREPIVKFVRAGSEKDYAERMSIARKGQSAAARNDYTAAVRFYNQYLSIVAHFKNSQPYGLTPLDFHPKDDLSEMLLLSHIYWDLAKVYDLAPNLGADFQKALDQFVLFTVKAPYHVVNAEMIRKYIRKGQLSHTKAFETTHSKIKSSAKKCYVASYCFGEDHYVTNDLRSFRDRVWSNFFAAAFIRGYYRISPALVDFCEKIGPLGSFLRLTVFRPGIYLFSRFVTKKSTR